MLGKRTLSLSLAFAALGLLWFPFAALQDTLERISEEANCLDDGITQWRTLLDDFADTHRGRLPTARERLALEARFRAERGHGMACRVGVGYEWNQAATRRNKDHPVPLVWCKKPHGFTHKWRNVLFTDLVLHEHMDERDIQDALRRGQSAP
jgi:hypothetical protein